MKCLYRLDTVRFRLVLIVGWILLAPRGFACSCSNNTPIQKSASWYTSPDRAVFTARVVALIGPIFVERGKRLSSQALAIVHQRYWGMPWYWPKIVLLNGSYPCDIVMAENEDHLVAGRKERYGVILVNSCSRTQPLRAAQLDLRTLDGTHCSAPGGTIIGHVRGEWNRTTREYGPVKVDSIALHDLDGNTYRGAVDENGIYELRHLALGLYAPESRLDSKTYLSGFGSLSGVQQGLCEEGNLTVRDYQLTGKLLPGIGQSVEVKLAPLELASEPIRADSIEPDGRFYFNQVPSGKYVLYVESTIGDTNPRIFYPGVTNREKAQPIIVEEGKPSASYDFAARVLPVVPIPLVLDPVTGSDKYLWDFQLLEGNRVIATRRAEGTNVALLYGMRGGSYRLDLYGYPRDPQNQNYCSSAAVPLSAVVGVAPVHIAARCAP